MPLHTGPPPARQVLWITPEVSVRPRSGGAIRTSRLLTALNAHTTVTVAVVGDCPGTPDLPPEWQGIRFVQLPRRGRIRASLIALARRQPRAMAACGGRRVRTLVKTAPPGSVVVLEHLALAGHGWTSPARLVLSLQNLDSDIYASAGTRGVVHRLGLLDAMAARRAERRLADRGDASVILVSEADASRLGGRSPRWVVPNGADIPASIEDGERTGFLFVGALDYEPNRLGLEWFVESVLPHLPSHLGSLDVIGRGGREASGRLASHPRVNVIGEVEEAAGFVRRARLTVVPLLSGGGTRVKILESAANATPFVATPAAAAGLDSDICAGGIVTADPVEFARSVAVLLEDDKLRATLGARGRQAVARHDWRVITEEFCHLVLGEA